jgi:hypothetical protein
MVTRTRLNVMFTHTLPVLLILSLFGVFVLCGIGICWRRSAQTLESAWDSEISVTLPTDTGCKNLLKTGTTRLLSWSIVPRRLPYTECDTGISWTHTRNGITSVSMVSGKWRGNEIEKSVVQETSTEAKKNSDLHLDKSEKCVLRSELQLMWKH